MKKGLFSVLRTYAHNVGGHARRLARRKESVREAAAQLTRDSRKLGHSILPSRVNENREEARRLVRSGRNHYNNRRFDRAEEEFRNAIVYDAKYALAYTYLGHTLYKQGKGRDARYYWEQAIRTDPNSEAAEKARAKLQHMEQRGSEVQDWIRERLDH